LKEYKLKFGLEYSWRKWHVVVHDNEYFIADCDSSIYMGFIKEEPDKYIYPLVQSLYSERELDNPDNSIKLSYKKLCPKCKKKFKVTQEDINHYLVLAKFGIKV